MWTPRAFPAREVPIVVPAHDTRFLYPAFPFAPLDPGELGIVDFKATAASGVTGTAERDPMSTATKAKLDTDIDLETRDVRQFALTLDDIPNKLFDAVEEPLGAFLEREGRYALDKSLDAHVLAAINASAPPFGQTGPP